MARKYTLSASSDEDFQLIGIATQLRDYRLCHQLNKNLYLELEKLDDLNAELSQEGTFGNFSFFHYRKPENFIDFFLIANKSSDGILLPELKQADYFLVIHGPFPNESLDRFLKTSKSLPGVLASFPIDISKPKKIDTFLMELELHVLTQMSKGKGKR
jgi:hypothetical protein